MPARPSSHSETSKMTQYFSSICKDTPEHPNLQPLTKAQSKSRIQVGSSSTQSQLGTTRNRDIPVFGSVAKSWANRPSKQLRVTHQRSSHFVVDKHDGSAPKDPPKVNEDLPTLEATHAPRITLEATSAVKERKPAIDDLKPVDPPNAEPSSIQYENKHVLKDVPKSCARRPSRHNSSQHTPDQPERHQRTSLVDEDGQDIRTPKEEPTMEILDEDFPAQEDLQPEASLAPQATTVITHVENGQQKVGDHPKPANPHPSDGKEGASGHGYPFKGVTKSWGKRPLKQVSSRYPIEPTKCKPQPPRESHSTSEEQGILNARPEPQVRLEHESEAPKEVEQRSALLEPKPAETPPPTPPHKDPWAPPTPSRHPDVSGGVAFLEKSNQSDRQESKPRVPYSRPTYEKTANPHRQNRAFEPSHRRIDAPRAPQVQRLHAQRSQPTLHSIKVNYEPSHIQSTHARTHPSPLIQDLQAQLSRAFSQLSDANETIQRLHRQSDAHAEHTSNLTASLKGCSEEISTLTTQNRIQVQKIVDLETQLREVRAENRELVEEKRWLLQELEDVKAERATLEGLEAERDKWKEQLECMHLRMVHAEHRVRSLNLDPLLQDKFAARRESWIPARCKAAISWLTSGAADEVVQTRVQGIVEEVKKLNEEMARAAGVLVSKLEWTRNSGSRSWFSLSVEPTAADRERAVKMVGHRVVTLMDTYAQSNMLARTQTQTPMSQAQTKTRKIPPLLMQTVLETVIIQWCVQIIEGTYPRQRSFKDVLVELARQQKEDKMDTTKPVERVHIVPTAHSPSPSPSLPQRHHHVNVPFDTNTCVSDVLLDLARVLSVAGVCIPPTPPASRSSPSSNRSSTTIHNRSALSSNRLFCSTIRPLLERAYDLRRAMAEEDLHGLVPAVCAPGAAFVGRYMLDACVQPQRSYSLRGEKDKGMGEHRAERRGVMRKISKRKVSGGVNEKRSKHWPAPEGSAQINRLKAEYVAGMSGLGLCRFGALGEREHEIGGGDEEQGIEMVLLPRVRLVSALLKESEVYATG